MAEVGGKIVKDSMRRSGECMECENYGLLAKSKSDCSGFIMKGSLQVITIS